MFNWIKSLYRRIAFTKYQRIENYIKLLEDKFELKKEKDKEVVHEIHGLINETLKAVKVLAWTSSISYFGIYFSVISAMLSTSAVLSGVTESLGVVVGFFGTTLFVVILFFSNKLADLYYQDLNLMTSHLITIYSKNKMIEENLFEGKNSYYSFIKFFKELKE